MFPFISVNSDCLVRLSIRNRQSNEDVIMTIKTVINRYPVLA